MIVGIGADGAITGIRVGGPNFSETMGLGAKTRDAEFTDQFQGQKGPISVGGKSDSVTSASANAENPSESGGHVDAVTSATISSRAVVSAVNTACSYVQGLLG
ncbi:Electron transport complex subunit RsxG [bioreactor metagenome]|uniref:Electron transport complex subunit RsxG n=1 Tax=bioreactor metagenome TaxID=1076179 RepID=A0A645AYB2_9ZZZZ